MAHHIIHRGAISGGNPLQYLPDFAGLTWIYWTAESLTAVGDGNPVGSWTDVYSGITISNTGTARPTYSSTGYVDFDGSDDELIVTGLSLDMSGGFNVYAVHDADTTAQNEGLISGKTTAAAHTSHAFEVYYSSATPRKPTYVVNRDATIGVGVVDSPTATTNKELWAVRPDSSLSPDEKTFRINGSNVTTLTPTGTLAPPSSTINVLTMGHGFSSALFDGHVYALAIGYGAKLDDSQNASVESALNSRFSVY